MENILIDLTKFEMKTKINSGILNFTVNCKKRTQKNARSSSPLSQENQKDLCP